MIINSQFERRPLYEEATPFVRNAFQRIFSWFEYMKPIFNSHLWWLFSLSSSEVLIMTCAHSFPAESVQEREITSADMACCCFTMHTDRCFQTQNTLAYLKNETHRHSWNTNTCLHRASLKDKTHRHALHKAAAPLPNGHLASLSWPAAVLCLFVGKNYQALQSVSNHCLDHKWLFAKRINGKHWFIMTCQISKWIFLWQWCCGVK